MADSYTLKLDLTLSPEQLSAIEQSFGARMAKMNKSFGEKFKSSLVSSLKGIATGGLIAAGMAIGQAILNPPIDKLNEALDNALEKMDNIATRSQQFGATSGQYYRLSAVAKSAGVDQEALDQILGRFAALQGDAKRGQENIASGFTGENVVKEFARALEGVKQIKDPTKQASVAAELFGQKAVGKLAELLQTNLANRASEIFGGEKNQEANKNLTQNINKVAAVEEKQAVLRQQTAFQDVAGKANVITEAQVVAQATNEQQKISQDNVMLKSYEAMSKTANSINEMKDTMQKGLNTITEITSKGFEGLKSAISKVKGWF